MNAVSPAGTVKANSGTEPQFGKSRTMVRSVDAVIAAAQRLWPRKTAAELAVRSGVGVRACEYWLARQSDLSADALAALLRSDAGLDILEAIIGDARPTWWRQFARTIEMSRLRKHQDEARKRLERLELDL